MITLPQLEEFFEATRQTYESGSSTWRVDDECRWSYFFVDTDREKLMPVATPLASQGYEFIGTLEPEPDDVNPVFYLRMDRIQRHSPVSLNKLNRELYVIAEQFGVESYDGMDVGAVDGP